MRRVLLAAAAAGLSVVCLFPSLAQDTKASDEHAQVAALKRDVDRLKTEVAAARKQIDEMKKAQGEMLGHVEALRTHRHQLFLDFLRADAFFPQAKGTFFVTTPSPDTLTKTSGPIAGQR